MAWTSAFRVVAPSFSCGHRFVTGLAALGRCTVLEARDRSDRSAREATPIGIADPVVSSIVAASKAIRVPSFLGRLSCEGMVIS
jgi:hypothetical protein